MFSLHTLHSMLSLTMGYLSDEESSYVFNPEVDNDDTASNGIIQSSMIISEVKSTFVCLIRETVDKMS
jgi:hypothetical protein